MAATQCSRCVLDTDVLPNVSFTDGLCEHCIRYDELLPVRTTMAEEGDRSHLYSLGERIKRAGFGKKYDCLIGVSGGVDSSYVAVLTKELGLRPLAVHLDNGWNSELAVMNIESLLRKLDVPLETTVLDWEEFRSLQVAFLRSGTPDGEVPTDHAINALLWKTAAKHNIRFILSGMNFSTESVSVPDWAYGHVDWRYIRDVNRTHGTKRLRTFPHFWLPYLAYTNGIRRIRIVSPLNLIKYTKSDAKTQLIDEFSWRDYGGKHFESTYTKFFQASFLPRRFNIDKRFVHCADLIHSGQMTKEEAMAELSVAPYPDSTEEHRDKLYVLKKLGLSESDYDEILTAPHRTFRDYKNIAPALEAVKTGVNRLRGAGLYPV